MEKLIITVGITGSRITRQQKLYTPITPEDVAQSGIEDWRAGASVLHISIPFGHCWRHAGYGKIPPPSFRSYASELNLVSHRDWFGSTSHGVIAMAMGGHVRAGLEDDIYYSKGAFAKSNGELVERVGRIAEEFGREIATPEESRKILSLF
jgi:uncharacterized protein (DUF849 family)